MQYIDTLPAYEDCAWKAARGIELEPVEQWVLEYSARAREGWDDAKLTPGCWPMYFNH